MLWILLGALALRMAAAVALTFYLEGRGQTYLMSGDAEGYWELGEALAAGRPYQLYEPPRKVMRMPGFPVFVAAAIRLASSLGSAERAHLIARVMLALAGTAACGLAAALGRELFDARIGNLAAAITAIAPPLIGFSVILLSETLFALFMLVSLYFTARLVRSMNQSPGRPRSLGWAAAAGVAVALAIYVRPSWLLAAPGIALLLVACFGPKRQKIESLAAAAILVAATFGALLPWAYRNSRVTGHWIFTTLWVGPSLYDGFSPNATGDSDLSFIETERPLDRLSEYEMDRDYSARAWRFVRDHPARAARLTAIKVARFWMPWPNAQQLAGWGPRLAVAAYFVPAVVLAVLGWIVGPRTFWGWTLTLGPILYFSAIHAVFLGSLRYRLPAEYALCVASAVGLNWIWKRPAGTD